MHLIDIVHNYIKQPSPLWENDATNVLVQNKRNEFPKYGMTGESDYSTAGWLLKLKIPTQNRFSISGNLESDIVFLEAASLDSLKSFYDEHGLTPYSDYELESNAALSKLKSAMALIELIKPANLCVAKLVRAIQIMKQEDSETDVSYSHPNIPFSIFVSVCQDNSIISNLRVAESIIHEAMHLKLTLIESIVQLVTPKTGNLYFSPWRDERRPAQGVLHGLFVFRAILGFFDELENIINSDGPLKYITARKSQISQEIIQLKDFISCPDLTEYGASLTRNLLP